MKGYRSNTFRKLGLGLIQLSLLASTIAVGVNSSAYGKSLTYLKSKTCSNSCIELNSVSPGLYTVALSKLSLKKVYKELVTTERYGFCSLSLKGHLSVYSGVSPPSLV